MGSVPLDQYPWRSTPPSSQKSVRFGPVQPERLPPDTRATPDSDQQHKTSRLLVPSILKNSRPVTDTQMPLTDEATMDALTESRTESNRRSDSRHRMILRNVEWQPRCRYCHDYASVCHCSKHSSN